MTVAATPSLAQALRSGIGTLQGGSETPRSDALLLLARALDCRREWILAHGEAPMNAPAAERFERWCRQRARGVPLAYLVGDAGFYGRTFAVDPRVLVPRPESEHLIDEVLAFVARAARKRVEILDVGVGSGALACTLAAELPQADVCGTDRCAGALEVAAANARRLGVARRCALYAGDLAAPVAGRRFDAVLANLPYVPSNEIDAAAPLRFEPRGALDGGPDGLDAYRRFVPAAPALLKPGGLLLLEAAPPQMAGLLELVRAAFAPVKPSVGVDYAGLARYVRLETAAS
ncbi:MAG TPA: peptide chain release factor N(5)-glutamine methyltransferase [Candidatus Tumulicola sp.]|nr:peptide chain release factor N(5)-glutamine methyltransferase [Candidatus Tumulicola sp.]